MRKPTVARIFLAVLAVLWGGCSQRLTDQQARRDAVLQTYFTEEAANVLDDVPLRSLAGNATKYRGIAIGDDVMTRTWGRLLGLGNRRQVVVSEQHLHDDALIVHEYLHQADYSGLINREDFVAQFAEARSDTQFATYAARREASVKASYGGTVFGQAEMILFDGLNTELLAFVGNDLATGRIVAPTYLWGVFARTLKGATLVTATSAAPDA